MLPDMESRYLQVNVFEGQRDVRGESSEWNLWRMKALLLRVCFEGLLALSIFRGIRRVALLMLG